MDQASIDILREVADLHNKRRAYFFQRGMPKRDPLAARKQPEAKKKMREWMEANRDRLRLRQRNYDNDRRRTDPVYAMARCLRARLQKKLKIVGGWKHYRHDELLGCSAPQLKAHIESQFQPGMTWDNRGTVWHVDHIRPLSRFNLLDPDEQKRACHFTNLQPLFATDNMQKQNKLIWPTSVPVNSQALLPLPAH